MTSVMKPQSDQSEVADHLATLIQRRGELLPSADDPHVLSELTSIDRRIRASGADIIRLRTGESYVGPLLAFFRRRERLRSR